MNNIDLNNCILLIIKKHYYLSDFKIIINNKVYRYDLDAKLFIKSDYSASELKIIINDSKKAIIVKKDLQYSIDEAQKLLELITDLKQNMLIFQ